MLEHNCPAVLAHECDWDDNAVIALHNLSPEPCRISLPLSQEEVVAYDDLLGDRRTELTAPCLDVTLEGYGYGWYRLQREGQRVVP